MTSPKLPKLLVAVCLLGAMVGLTFIDWRPARPALPPIVQPVIQLEGRLSVGSARVDLTPALPTVVAGYVPWRPVARSAKPLFARAVVLRSLDQTDQTLGIVSSETIWVPADLVEQVRQKGRELGLTNVLVTATHPHSSFGGFDQHPLAQWAATGIYHRKLAQHLVDKLVEALRAAQQSMQPVKLRSSQVAVPGITRNRDADHPVDQELSVSEFDNENNKPVARLVIFGSHPTLVDRHGDQLDGDWPSRAMMDLEKDGGVALVLQGALGDISSVPLPGDQPRAERMGWQVARSALAAIKDAPADDLQTAASVQARVALPGAQADYAVPRWLRRPAANLLDLMAPRQADVAVLRLGRTWLLMVPAEPTMAAAQALREQAAGLVPQGEHLVVVGIAQGYVMYLETPQTVQQGNGEARRTMFGPQLQERLGQGLIAGLKAMRAALHY